MKPRNSKTKEASVCIDQQIEAKGGEGDTQLPLFFLTRSIGWFAFTLAIFICTLFFVQSNANSFLTIGAGAAVGVLCIARGVSMLVIGKKRRFFVLRLTCMDVRLANALENLPAYLNPTSNTAFRSSQQVTFFTNTGTKVIFSYEKSRRFLVGARYDFYFNKPYKESDNLTVDMLEGLRIDHAIVQEEIAWQDKEGI